MAGPGARYWNFASEDLNSGKGALGLWRGGTPNASKGDPKTTVKKERRCRLHHERKAKSEPCRTKKREHRGGMTPAKKVKGGEKEQE